MCPLVQIADMKLMFALFTGAPTASITAIQDGLKLMADIFQKFIESWGYGWHCCALSRVPLNALAPRFVPLLYVGPPCLFHAATTLWSSCVCKPAWSG